MIYYFLEFNLKNNLNARLTVNFEALNLYSYNNNILLYKFYNIL